MAIIKTVYDLQHGYDEVSRLCHEGSGPVFIERDGAIDLVVMSIELYEALSGETGIMEKIEHGFLKE